MVIARYNNLTVEITYTGFAKTERKIKIKFLEFFEGTDEKFIAKWKKDYPNHSFQIFRHIRKPLSVANRKAIEESTEFKQKLLNRIMNPIWELVDITKLNEKIKEWESQGLSESEIILKGSEWAKEFIKNISWKERKALMNRIDRDNKIEELLK